MMVLRNISADCRNSIVSYNSASNNHQFDNLFYVSNIKKFIFMSGVKCEQATIKGKV
jgi:hypothetical protein